MVYCLLPNKERQTYNRALMLLKDAAMTQGLSLDPSVIISDFELAMNQAAALNFLNSNHRGCYYHFMQAIWRKVRYSNYTGTITYILIYICIGTRSWIST